MGKDGAYQLVGFKTDPSWHKESNTARKEKTKVKNQN